MMDWTTLFFGSVALLAQHYAEDDLRRDKELFFPTTPIDYSLPKVETYDFIVVGGGTAGCTVASRLSENPNVKVLLLEAGGTPPPVTEVPAFAPDARAAPAIIYDYISEPQINANNVRIKAPVGKLLGGTSSINYMFFNRGSPHDFDNWANITGDPSWRYDQVLEHFKKSENYNGYFTPGVHHGTAGPLRITGQRYAPGVQHWFEAGREKGYLVDKDPNGPQIISFNPVEYNKHLGKRVGAYQGFLKPVEASRTNLKVVKYAEVDKILINGTNNKATGVLYNKHGVFQGAYATKEIIISAGTYGSAKLLMKSGIGPKEILEQANIKMVVDLPVGQNLQDHPLVPVKILVTDGSILFDPKKDLDENTADEFLLNGVGPLTSTSGLAAQGFIASAVAKGEGNEDWADIQFSLYSQNFPTALPNSYDNESAIFMYPYLGRPKSRGWVTLDPTNVNNPPIIDFNFLHDIRDVQIFTEAIETTLDIMETTEAYSWVGASYPTEPLPNCQHLTFRSTAYWDCYVRNTIIGGNHPVGTCSMGRGTGDPTAVVDSKLKVIGVEGLRVADGSIMPVINNANIQAAIFMIGEKCAAEIKTAWNL